MPLPITERDIQIIYNKIKDLGQNPTIDSIIQAHGGGSKSTVGPILKRLKEQDARPDSTAGVPNTVFNPLKAIFEKMEQDKSEWERQKTKAFEVGIQKQIDLTEEQIQWRKKAETQNEALKTIIDTLKDQLANKEKALGETQVELTTLRDQVKEQQGTIKHQQSEIQKLHEAGQAIRANAQKDINALSSSHKEFVSSLKAQINVLSKEKDHALQQCESDRTELQQIQQELIQNKDRLATTESRLSAGKQEQKKQNEIIDQLKSEFIEKEHSNKLALKDIKELGANLKLVSEDLTQSNTELEKLKINNAELNAKLETKDEIIKKLTRT